MSEKDWKEEKKGGIRDSRRARERKDSGKTGNNKDQTTLRQTKRPQTVEEDEGLK